MRNLRRLSVVLLVMILTMSLSAVAFAQETATPAPGGEAEPMVTVSEQEIVDGTVTIDNVVAAENGWLVVHRSEDGSVGADIGHTAVEAGENPNVVVELDLEQATETMYAMLHVDAGTEGTYEFPGADTPVQGDAANVNPSFTVTNLADVQEAPAAQETATPAVEATETPEAGAAAQETATPAAAVTPGTLPQTGANLQEATPATLPQTGANLQEATPATLPQTGANLQEATPATLPQTGASLQEATPATLPQTGANLQEATPATLPQTGAGGTDWTLPLLALGVLILIGGLGLSMSRRPR